MTTPGARDRAAGQAPATQSGAPRAAASVIDAPAAAVEVAVEVTLEIAAPADRVYALIADLPGMADLSPECARVSWIPPATAAVPGAQFRGVNRHGPFRWVTICTVERAEPGRELVFSVRSHGLPVARWRYRIVETSVGCTVVESTEDLRGLFARLAGPLVSGVSDRAARNAVTMRGTLARLKERAEGSTAADPTAADPTALA